jgi:hypothetical protein
MKLNRQTRRILHRIGCLAAVVFFAHLSGCLNPAFVNNLTGGSTVPIAPGDTPYIHVLFINATQATTIELYFGWTPEYQGSNWFHMTGISPLTQRGLLLGCPINQIGLGNPDDLALPAMVLTTSTGTVNVPPSAFPLTLHNGTDYVCGDMVVFTIVDDRNNGYGINVSPGRVDGSNQGGPFTGPDTYAIYQALQFSGSTPIPIP